MTHTQIATSEANFILTISQTYVYVQISQYPRPSPLRDRYKIRNLVWDMSVAWGMVIVLLATFQPRLAASSKDSHSERWITFSNMKVNP